MKKLYVEDQLPVDATTAWDLFESEAFRERLASETGLSAVVLASTDEGTVQRRTLRFTSKNELPGVASKALGMKHLTYDQTTRFDRATGRLDWTVKLPVLTDRVRVEGRTVITDTPGGSRRVVDGQIEVSMPVIGGQIEKVVVGEFEKSMRRAVDIVRGMIRDRGAT